ncbi:MAG TPA: diphosphomevalonate decarboxylase, partial [Longilinea sp.]|nr:diphosphomevalonate decarboxylase [Longilinea sp.]
DSQLHADSLSINGVSADEKSLTRMSAFLEVVRQWAGSRLFAAVVSENNFPLGSGVASSASAFAALAMASAQALGMNLAEQELSHLARHGSGSACRSIPGGFVEWKAGQSDADSYAVTIAPPDHWQLADVTAIVSSEQKTVSSAEGHQIAATSPLQAARVAGADRRLDICRSAILKCDFDKLAAVTELDSNLMHAVMMTSTPALFYWRPETLAIMQAVTAWRQTGLPVCYTIDAGPNVHVICPADVANEVAARLASIPGVSQTLCSQPGPGASLVE